MKNVKHRKGSRKLLLFLWECAGDISDYSNEKTLEKNVVNYLTQEGTGKTTFYSLISNLAGEDKVAQNVSGTKIYAVPNDFDSFRIENYSGYVLVLDEFCSLFRKSNIASILQGSNNYFILINRNLSELGYLPLHVDSIFTMKTSGKFHTLEKMYSRFIVGVMQKVDVVITEDTKSSYLFIKDMLDSYNSDILVTPAYGDEVDLAIQTRRGSGGGSASKIHRTMQRFAKSGKRDIFVVYDASAFGCYVDLINLVIREYPDVNFYILDWDSFEYYILNSKLIRGSVTYKDVDYTYESFEQFCTDKLKEFIPAYTKSKLPLCLKVSGCVSCKHTNDCAFVHYDHNDLIYGGLERLKDAAIVMRGECADVVNLTAFDTSPLKQERH